LQLEQFLTPIAQTPSLQLAEQIYVQLPGLTWQTQLGS
jgi:hypothetical protein